MNNFKWRKTKGVVTADKMDLEIWVRGGMTTTECISRIKDRNRWKDTPTKEEFLEMVERLGYKRVKDRWDLS